MKGDPVSSSRGLIPQGHGLCLFYLLLCIQKVGQGHVKCKNQALNKYLFKEKLLNEKKLHISQDEKLHNH